MLLKYENKRIYAQSENPEEEQLLKAISGRLTDSNKLISWVGDAEFNNKQTTAYIFTWQLGKEPGIGVEPSKEVV